MSPLDQTTVQPLQFPAATKLTDCPLQRVVAVAVMTGTVCGALAALMVMAAAPGPSPQLFRKKAVYCPGVLTAIEDPVSPLDQTTVQPLQLPVATKLTGCPSQISGLPVKETTGLAEGNVQAC